MRGEGARRSSSPAAPLGPVLPARTVGAEGREGWRSEIRSNRLRPPGPRTCPWPGPPWILLGLPEPTCQFPRETGALPYTRRRASRPGPGLPRVPGPEAGARANQGPVLSGAGVVDPGVPRRRSMRCPARRLFRLWPLRIGPAKHPPVPAIARAGGLAFSTWLPRRRPKADTHPVGGCAIAGASRRYGVRSDLNPALPCFRGPVPKAGRGPPLGFGDPRLRLGLGGLTAGRVIEHDAGQPMPCLRDNRAMESGARIVTCQFTVYYG